MCEPSAHLPEPPYPPAEFEEETEGDGGATVLVFVVTPGGDSHDTTE